MSEKDRDPGDSVPEGVAVKYPAPLSEHDIAVKQKLEKLGTGVTPDEETKETPAG